MPINNELSVVELPTGLGFDEPIKTEFHDHLDSIKTKLVSCPSIEELRNYIPDFCTATWAEQPFNKGSLSDYENIIRIVCSESYSKNRIRFEIV